MTSDNLTIGDVINQDGGSMQISFEDYCIVAPTNDVHQAMRLLKTYNKRGQVALLKSVCKSIRKTLPSIKDESATKKEAMHCAQDIVIWFANEVLHNRATLEQRDLKFIGNATKGS